MSLAPDQEERLQAIMAGKGLELRPETLEQLGAKKRPPGDRQQTRGGHMGEELSGRERQVLQHAADGFTNGEIAEILFLSEETIKSHIRHVLDKLDARSRTHAVAIAFRQEIIF